MSQIDVDPGEVSEVRHQSEHLGPDTVLEEDRDVEIPGFGFPSGGAAEDREETHPAALAERVDDARLRCPLEPGETFDRSGHVDMVAQAR
ncbi:hypothetical protein GCM10023201_27250 [Actinomycetospora corticicola]